MFLLSTEGAGPLPRVHHVAPPYFSTVAQNGQTKHWLQSFTAPVGSHEGEGERRDI